MLQLVKNREKERRRAESGTGVVKCAPNLGEVRVAVSGTVLATFSSRFVILQNTGVEGKKK